MKRAPYTYGAAPDDQPRQWSSVEEFAESTEFKIAMEREFPDGASELTDGVSRRGFIGLMGASLGLAGLAGCRRPEEHILPYNSRGEDVVEGNALHYATAMSFYGTAMGLLVESHEGRPTKIEGNPRHPDSGAKSENDNGGSTTFVQAAVLDLYDTDRSNSPRGGAKTWDDAFEMLKKAGADFKTKNGKGLAILTEAHRSPTVQALLDNVKKQLPEAKVVRYEAFGRSFQREGARLAFGRPLETVTKTSAAKVLVSIGSDFLNAEGSPIKNARGFADGRRLEKPGDQMNRLYVAESHFSVTGASADHRLRLPTSQLHDVALGLAAALGNMGAPLGVSLPQANLDATKQRWVQAVARDLAAHKGAGLIVAGEQLPPAVHAIVHLANLALGNVGKTVDYVAPFTTDAEGPQALTQLAESAKRGEVEFLLILGGNPVYNAPVDADFAAALAKIKTSVHLSSHVDETSTATTTHLPRAHFLESWGDVRSEDGTASIQQPLIAPLLNGKTDAEVLERLLGGTRTAYQLVTATWQSQGGLSFSKVWRKALHDGIIAGTASPSEKVTAAADGAALANVSRSQGLEVTFHPDMHAWDGRFANNSWMMELPEQITKLSWDNAALLSPETAKKLGVTTGSMLAISVDRGKTIQVAALIAPGQADDSVALTVGLGRKVVGSVGTGAGFDVNPIRLAAQTGFATATVKAAGGAIYQLTATQEHSSMEGRPMVRETSLTKYLRDPKFVQKQDTIEKKDLFSLFPDEQYNGHKWGMVIDLNACIGCNACMVACQSENNLPVVGKKNVGMGRSMHWIRIDRYYTGTINDPQAVVQPVGCQHCENAPCEQVCPVGATTHSPEGLNQMAYNRCIGTRYCANNCPYKVRRFNFFNYFKDVPELRTMQFNPEVTVRHRGVIEKCTYCVQRINEAKISAHRSGRDRVADGEVRSACQTGCPTQAITFGDLNDKESAVAKMAENTREYKMLEELNVRPRTSFLGRVRNPNPELA